LMCEIVRLNQSSKYLPFSMVIYSIL